MSKKGVKLRVGDMRLVIINLSQERKEALG